MIQGLSPLGRAQQTTCSSKSPGPGPWLSIMTTNNNSNLDFHVFSAYYVPGTVPRGLPVLAHWCGCPIMWSGSQLPPN